MEAIGGHVPDGSQRPTVVGSVHRLRRIFDHEQAVPRGDLHNAVHFAAYPGVMHRKDSLGAGRDRFFNQLFVDVHRVRSDVDKHRPRHQSHDGIGSGNKRVGGQDHFVAGAEVAEHGCNFQRRGA